MYTIPDDPSIRREHPNELRESCPNPPEWVKTQVMEFPASVDGPWARFVVEPDARGIGTARWPRLVPKTVDAVAMLKERTLTNLDNERPTWLIHVAVSGPGRARWDARCRGSSTSAS